jgi:hypothetical protein
VGDPHIAKRKRVLGIHSPQRIPNSNQSFHKDKTGMPLPTVGKDGRAREPRITFSYKQTSGAGGNPLIARVKTALNENGYLVEMKHGSADGRNVHVDQSHNEHPGSKSRNFEDWMVHWKKMADRADLVVIWDSESDGYDGSEACQMESRYAKAHCKHCCMGKYIDAGESAEQMARRILAKF